MKFYTSVSLYRDYIHVRGYEGHRRIQEKHRYEPYLFLPSQSPTGYKTLDGRHVKKKDFGSCSQAREFIKDHSGFENFEIFGLTNWPYLYIHDEYPGEIQFDPSKISVVSLDIETMSDSGFPDVKTGDKEITAITICKNGKFIVFGCRVYYPTDPNVQYVLCQDERELMRNFLVTWNKEEWSPDVVTGWNIDGFDIPYLINRTKALFGEDSPMLKMFSPWGRIEEREFHGRGGEMQTIYEIAGITVLDYLSVYKKFSFSNHESYKLDHICKVELGFGKLDYSEYDSLHDLYLKNFQKYIDYNIEDTRRIFQLDDKLKFLELIFTFAYDAKCMFGDTMATVRPWDIIIHNYLMEDHIVIPQQKKNNEHSELIGGYVKEPQVGLHKWVVSFDLQSSYPHQIMQYNLSPEAFRGRLSGFPELQDLVDQKHESLRAFVSGDVSVAGNGCTYSRDFQGFLPKIMEKMYDDRTLYKKKMIEAKKEFERTKDKQTEKLISKYHNLQIAKKTQLNAGYGALTNQYFRWFDFNLAEAITTSGQLAIRFIERKMNEYMNRILKTKGVDYVIASDTDSIYLNMGPLVDKVSEGKGWDTVATVQALDAFCQGKLQPYIEASFEELAQYMQAYQQKMFMKRENIADKGIWKAKKMYILNVHNSEGVQYKEPKLKMMGIEAVRSSTPYVVRQKIEGALKIIMSQDEPALVSFIDEFKQEFFALGFEDVGCPRGIKNMWKYHNASSIYGKSTPIQVRGALLYNNYLKRKGIADKYQPIQDGDKIKFVHLKMPNPLHDTIISSPGELPKQFDLDRFIDYETQFEKTFVEPLRNITQVIGWNTENVATLEDFFS